MFELMADNVGSGSVDNTQPSGGSVAAIETPSAPSASPETTAPAGLPFTDGTAPTAPTGTTPETASAPPEKPTPKEVSEAINRATARAAKEIERYKARDAEIAQNLKAIGMPEDINLAAAQIMATANNIPLSDAIARQTASRDMEVLGRADAAEIIESGDIEAELKKLTLKPIPLRTKRDLICFQELTATKKLNDETAELSKVGVDVNKLKSDTAFSEFNKKLNPELPIAERYELYKKSTQTAPATPPPSVASKGGTPKKDFFTSDEVDRMSRDEVRENLTIIQKSMTKW